MTTYPLDRGSIEFKGKWDVKNGKINSQNHLLIIDPRISGRIRNNQNRWLPLKVVMYFIRERGNAIDYSVPITGNLRDPKFHLKDVIFDVITNIFVKPPTTPYSFEVKSVENNIEKILSFNWELRSARLVPDHKKFVDDVVDFLKDHPGTSISVQPVQYEDKEKEYILFFEAKKKYYFEDRNRKTSTMTEGDSVNIEKMSFKDSSFVHYLKKHAGRKLMYTAQERCLALIGKNTLDAKFNELVKKRAQVFKDYFAQAGVAKQITIKKSENKVPFNGFSYYRIDYNGNLPPETKAAFETLKNLDSEEPREKLTDERKKTRWFFNKK
jgi:hypothetical protein